MRFKAFAIDCAGALSGLLGIIALGEAAQAHPHVWVTVETELLHDENKSITGFQHRWTFDELYSEFATQGLDKNGDGVLDRDELKDLAKLNVDSMAEFGFFTFAHFDGNELARLPARDYWLEYQDKMLILQLTLPLKNPVPWARLEDFNFSVYDPTFYVGFELARKDPVRLQAGLGECRAVLSRPEVQTPVQSLSQSVQSSNDALLQPGGQYAQTVRLKCRPGS